MVMKKGIILILFTVLCLQYSNAQNIKSTGLSSGTWKFAAPYAPEGYSSGTIVIGSPEKKDTATMSFGTGEYKLPGENVKVINDSVLFSIFLEGQDIKVMLKVDSDTSMSGKAVYSEGEVPLLLNRIIATDAAVKN
jgi:hypothetical protein